MSSDSQAQTLMPNINVGQATISRSDTTTMHEINTTSNPNALLAPAYIFAATLATCLCTVVGIIIAICVLKQIRKHKRMVAVPLYDEITDPIYAIVPGATNEDKSKSCVDSADKQIELSHNDAYKQVLSKNVHTAQLQPGVSLTVLNDNTAYVPSNFTIDSVATIWNDSYHFATSMTSQNKTLDKLNTLDISKDMIIGDPTDTHTSAQHMKPEHSDDPDVFNTDWKRSSHGNANRELLNPKQDSEEQNENKTKGSLDSE